MKAVILAGGFGTRLSEYTEAVPKPMVEIGGKPILIHLMEALANYGLSEFVIATGYKSELIKKLFRDLHLYSSNIRVDCSTGVTKIVTGNSYDWTVDIVDTGLKAMTGGRLLALRELLKEDDFLLTYGDGLSDVDITELTRFHKSHGKEVTVTAVRPPARFGELKIENTEVIDFSEKPQTSEGWINGGFFIMNPRFINRIEAESSVLEAAPLAEAAHEGQVRAFQHTGFWQCMDTKRDKDYLEQLIIGGNTPWINNS
jgi:glucose-1-phosphate cytidylyltransferase